MQAINNIISLTTYGTRILSVHVSIKTLLNQTLKSDKVILWLSEDEFNLENIPITLKNLLSLGLEIEFCKDLKSYKKLIPTLKKYPDHVVITFDDDIIYKNDTVEKLVEAYKREPNVVHCMRGHKIRFKKNAKIDLYNNWDMLSNDFDAGFDIFPTGAGGILYPLNCFYKDILNEDLFLNFAPYGDDIWFKAMSLKQGKKCKIVEQSNNEYMNLNYIEGTQKNALWLRNSDEKNGNNPQIKAVFEKYDLESFLNKSKP